MEFPITRMRRLRRTETLRRMVRETKLTVDDLIMPLFVRHGSGIKRDIPSMPGQHQFSPDTLAEQCHELEDLGVPAVILFGIPETKDPDGSEASKPGGIITQSIEAIKAKTSSIQVICDVCLCEYTDHGHCGIIAERRDGVRDVDNDATLERLGEEAVVCAEAGADMVAPSDMMDGRVAYIRERLDDAGFESMPILAYSAKYASGFYGPFRDAAESPPQFGDRRTYQMDPPNVREALREIDLDISEGADMVMVKPALAYLDVIRAASELVDVPMAAYSVSGEYSMIKAAGLNGWLDERQIALEVLTSIKRAGADLILTYWAREAAEWLH